MQKRNPTTEDFQLVNLVSGSNTITHTLNKAKVLVKLRDDASGQEMIARITNEAINSFDIVVAVARNNVRVYVE